MMDYEVTPTHTSLVIVCSTVHTVWFAQRLILSDCPQRCLTRHSIHFSPMRGGGFTGRVPSSAERFVSLAWGEPDGASTEQAFIASTISLQVIGFLVATRTFCAAPLRLRRRKTVLPKVSPG